MLQNQKHVFWEALVIAIFIFALGIILGIFIENSRASEISNLYTKSELSLLDIKTQSEMLDLNNLKCDALIQENLKFGNTVYEEAQLLGRYEDANRITNSLIEQHKKYDLLRLIFWINSIKIKEKCNANFHTLVYLYNYNIDDNAENSKQYVISKFLGEIKDKYGNNVILIPLARNLNISSIDLMAQSFNITQTTVMLDEKIQVTDISKLNEINAALD